MCVDPPTPPQVWPPNLRTAPLSQKAACIVQSLQLQSLQTRHANHVCQSIDPHFWMRKPGAGEASDGRKPPSGRPRGG